MSQADAGARAQIEGAVSRWNACINGAYLELGDLIGAVQEDLEGLALLVADRPAIAPVLAAPEELGSAAAAGAATARLDTAHDALAGFHVELQTLHAQVRRTLGAAERLVEEVRKTTTTISTAPMPLTAAESAPVKTAREAQLNSQVVTLRSELLRVKDELRDALGRMAARATAPPDAQNEIARLRTRVLELMAQQGESRAPKREDLSVQYERILAQAADAEGRRKRMGEILLSAGVISQDQLDTALREQQTSWNRHLGMVLVDLGYVSEDTVAQTLAAQIRLPYVRLIHDRPKPEALQLVSKALAHHHSCVPLRFERDTLVVAMANPLDLVAIDDIELATRRPVQAVVASHSEIRAALKEHYR
jgi:hypothetical protein